MPIRFDDFELDEGRRQLLRNGEPLHIAAKQFLLLQTLIERRPNAISKRELYDRLWPNTHVSDVNLPSIVAELRTILGDDAHQPRYIRTVHGFGYAFCGPALPEAENAVATLSGNDHIIRLAQGETIVGRELALHPSVSRRHAAIMCEGETCHIRDLGSKNGTNVGGVRVTEVPRELHDGDVVTLGSVRLTFHRARPTSTITMAE
jgi:DNA-binding winged helix-turn-helix (wHTH) protein